MGELDKQSLEYTLGKIEAQLESFEEKINSQFQSSDKSINNQFDNFNRAIDSFVKTHDSQYEQLMRKINEMFIEHTKESADKDKDVDHRISLLFDKYDKLKDEFADAKHEFELRLKDLDGKDDKKSSSFLTKIKDNFIQLIIIVLLGGILMLYIPQAIINLNPKAPTTQTEKDK